MPLICVGPICVPISAVLPLILWALRPIWEALPEPMRARIESATRPFLNWLDERVFSKLRGMFGGKGKMASTPASAAKGALAVSAGAIDAAFATQLAAALDAGRGEVHSVGTREQLAAARALSAQRGCAVVLDFTAPWCGPCQRIKPKYAELAKAQSAHIFLAIDVDDAPELQADSKVIALPTFQVYFGERKEAEVRGGTDSTIEALGRALSTAAKKAD